MSIAEAQPIKVGNPRRNLMLAYHRQCMTTCIKTMWEDSLMAEHREKIEPMLGRLAATGDLYEAIEDANEYFCDGIWDSVCYAKECLEHCKGWMTEYHALWEKLNREELKALRTILDSNNAQGEAQPPATKL